MKALSIKQPWSWLIVNGYKEIENRDWPTKYRGQILIHAGKTFDDLAMYGTSQGVRLFSDFKRLLKDNLDEKARLDFAEGHCLQLMGGFVGIAEIVDCVKKSSSPWFFGEYGFVLKNARPLPFYPFRGQLGLFEVPQEVERHYQITAQKAKQP